MPLEPDCGARNERGAGCYTSIVDHRARRKVVGAIEYDLGGRDHFTESRVGQPFVDLRYFEFRIGVLKGLRRRAGLEPADIVVTAFRPGVAKRLGTQTGLVT